MLFGDSWMVKVMLFSQDLGNPIKLPALGNLTLERAIHSERSAVVCLNYSLIDSSHAQASLLLVW